MCRGVTRLDGAWGNKYVWRSHVRTWGLSEANVLFRKKFLWHCCDFLGLRSDLASGELCPPAPSLRLWRYAIKIGKFSENELIFKSESHELIFHEHLQFSNTIRHESCTDCQQRLLAVFQVFSCSFCVTSMPAPASFRLGPVFVLLIRKFFWHPTSYFFKVR